MKVTLQNLTKIFPNRNRKRQPVTAVYNISFEIPDGKLVGLLGPSGCGKSTTLNLISGLEKPTSGTILFGDDDVAKLPPENRGVGWYSRTMPSTHILQSSAIFFFPL